MTVVQNREIRTDDFTVMDTQILPSMFETGDPWLVLMEDAVDKADELLLIQPADEYCERLEPLLRVILLKNKVVNEVWEIPGFTMGEIDEIFEAVDHSY